MWSLRNISYSSRILMSSRTKATKGQWKTTRRMKERRKKWHSECTHTHMCNKEEESDVSVCKPNCASFVINCFFVSQLKRASHYSCCSCSMRQGQIQSPHVIKFQFILYAWYKKQLGHCAAFACILHKVRTIQKHVYIKRENKAKYHKMKTCF